MLYLRVAIQAVDLLLGNMFVMDQFNIGILLCSIHMAEVAFFLRRYALAFGDLYVALVAFVTRLQRCLMREALTLIGDRFSRR